MVWLQNSSGGRYDWGTDAAHVRGIQKFTTHQYLNAIVLLASALAVAHHSERAAA
ncbi:hypothetical protein [Paenibacillus naphthalenovorans]|uniref:hypothetical protein n=1 Tax=Paenibacillus naphthalenovorans TaxID=162209 RepID=UPI003D29F69F